MRPLSALVLLTACALLSGCAAGVPIASQSGIVVDGAYTPRVPGKWALYVDGSDLPKSQDEDETFCPTFTWSMDVAPALRTTLATTFETLSDGLVLVDHRLTAQAMRAAGYTGTVSIRAEDFRLQLSTEQELSSTMAIVTADMGARLTVTDRRGVVLEQSASSSGRGVGDSGIVCENNGAEIKSAVESAMRDLVARLGAQFMSAPALRYLPG